MFRRILVYLGDRTTADVAVAAAGRLAAACGARLDLVDVSSTDVRQVWAIGDASGRTLAARGSEQRLRLAAAADRLIEGGLDVDTHQLDGPLPGALLAHLAGGGHDLLVKASQQGTTQDEAFAGVLDDQLMRLCPVPVWLARAGRIPARIAAAVEVTPLEEQPDAIDLGVLDMAAMLARRLKADLHVVHAAAPLPLRAPEPRNLLAGLLSAGRVNLPADHIHRLVGRPADVVPRWLRVANVDLLVLGTEWSTPPEQDEGTAEALLRRAPGSVLTLRVARPARKPQPAHAVILAGGHAPREAAAEPTHPPPHSTPPAHGSHAAQH